MTKKDFEWFASMIRIYPNLTMDYDFLDEAMEWFSMRNPNFDRRRFLLACEFSEEEIKEIWDV